MRRASQCVTPLATYRYERLIWGHMDSASFARKLTEHYARLWLIAMAYLQDRALAEDVVHDAVLVALDKLDQFESGGNFAAWLGKIVRLKAKNEARTRKRRKTYATDPEQLRKVAASSRASSPRDDVRQWAVLHNARDDFDDEVTAALATLSVDARAALLLRTVADLSYVEISELLGIPAGTAMSHVHRARRQLQKTLEQSRSKRVET